MAGAVREGRAAAARCGFRLGGPCPVIAKPEVERLPRTIRKVEQPHPTIFGIAHGNNDAIAFQPAQDSLEICD